MQGRLEDFSALNREIHVGVGVASKEIPWRLHDIARNMALDCLALDSQESKLLQSLIALHDAGHCALSAA